MIKNFLDKEPQTDKAAFIDEGACVFGDVELGENSSVWFGASLRGDLDSIKIGKNTNIQENSVIHVDAGTPCEVRDNVTIGHGVILHGCTIGNNCLIGMGAIILNNATIADNSIVGAGALVTEGKTFEQGALIIGSPAKEIKKLTPQMSEKILRNAEEYVDLAKKSRK